MQLEINTNNEVILSNIYTGVGVQTDDGLFGIAQRDMGIEVMLDGRHVWSSDDREPLEPITFAVARDTMARGLLDDDGTYTAYHANVAMVLHDSGFVSNIGDCNDLAAQIVNLVFGIDPDSWARVEDHRATTD